MRIILSLVLGVACAMSARADIESIGEFSGQFSEGFESFPNYLNGGRYSMITVGGGELESIPLPPEQLRIFEPDAGATWGLGDYGFAVPNSGEKGLGVQMDDLSDPTIAFNLETPARQFGFYYATAFVAGTFPPELRVSLFDDQGNQLEDIDVQLVRVRGVGRFALVNLQNMHRKTESDQFSAGDTPQKLPFTPTAYT